jgi:16S rRNA (adenine1518-N6/adenine1519-N6)-dimethyltransferase
MRKGQHFLVDDRIAERQIGYASLSDEDVVLEIGAGYGVLTKRMARKAGKVIAIEIDPLLAESLNGISNVEVICDDALNVDFNELEFNKVVSNLPYQISSPVTFKLLKRNFKLGILMYQKEFAERLVAEPGSKTYSRLSVMASYAADWEMLETVPPSAFRPRPRVHSCIVRVIPEKPKFEVKNEEIFYDLTRALFSHRRKKIKNSLFVEGFVSQKEVGSIPYGDNRIEELSPVEIGRISDMVATVRGKND